MNQTTENDVKQSVKIDRKLPPHELNARRARKRAVTKLPAVADLPAVGELLSIKPGLAPGQKGNS